MKAKELRQIAPETLQLKVEELRAQIEQMRFGSQKGSEKNVNKLSMVRHELSRILTILTEHEKNSHSSTK
jgi:ribosomal protein L29